MSPAAVPGQRGFQATRNQLRAVFLAAISILGVVFLWTTSDTDSTLLTSALPEKPMAAPASVWPDVPAVVEGDSEPVPPPPSTEAAPAVLPFFVLVGDSTTNGHTTDGGGWGDAFIWLLTRGAEGTNRGFNGAHTAGYYHSPLWADVLQTIQANAASRKVYTTIQFGHNDQLPGNNITLEKYEQNLVAMAREVMEAGGTPILVTPLARRDFDVDGVTVVDNLGEYREATLRAHRQVVEEGEEEEEEEKKGEGRNPENRARVIDLNAASLAYIGAIGKTAAFRYNKYNPFFPDTTHLNEHGAVVFGRMVADLMLGHPAALVPSGERDRWTPGQGNDDAGLSGWIQPNPYLTGLIWHGDAA